jgi:hypothetical protein
MRAPTKPRQQPAPRINARELLRRLRTSGDPLVRTWAAKLCSGSDLALRDGSDKEK